MLVRPYCNQERLRLDRQVSSFREEFEHDLERLTNDMLQKLDNKVPARTKEAMEGGRQSVSRTVW